MATTAENLLTPEEMKLDGERSAYVRHVKGRKVAYVNTEVWIGLGRDDKLALECRSLCEDAVNQKRVIFPLSYAACSELAQQAPSPSRAERVGLMQSLSEGIALAESGRIFGIGRARPHRPHPRQEGEALGH